jgi:hypothetical protein
LFVDEEYLVVCDDEGLYPKDLTDLYLDEVPFSFGDYYYTTHRYDETVLGGMDRVMFFSENGITLNHIPSPDEHVVYFKNPNLLFDNSMNAGSDFVYYSHNFETGERERIEITVESNVEYPKFCLLGSAVINEDIYVAGYYDGRGGNTMCGIYVQLNAINQSIIYTVSTNDFHDNGVFLQTSKNQLILTISKAGYYLLEEGGLIQHYSLEGELLETIQIPDYDQQSSLETVRMQNQLFIYGDNQKLLLIIEIHD